MPRKAKFQTKEELKEYERQKGKRLKIKQEAALREFAFGDNRKATPKTAAQHLIGD